MKTAVTLNDFRDAFVNYNRENNFSFEGLEALYNWLIEYEEDTGEEQELEVIALCCDFAEYESALECAREYGWDFAADIYDDDDKERGDDEVAEELKEKAIDWLSNRTTAILFPGGIIIQQF